MNTMERFEKLSDVCKEMQRIDKNGTYDEIMAEITDGANGSIYTLVEILKEWIEDVGDTDELTRLLETLESILVSGEQDKIDTAEFLSIIEESVDYMIKEGTEYTTTGNWTFDYAELPCGKEFARALDNVLVAHLLMRADIVADAYTIDGFIDVDYYTAYCPNVDEDDNEDEEVAEPRPRVIVTIHGGIVENVFTNIDRLDIEIIDLDVIDNYDSDDEKEQWEALQPEIATLKKVY